MKSLPKVPKSAVFLVAAILASVFLLRFLFIDATLVSDDYLHHAARTANYYLALKQGQMPPRWAPNLNRGFGYPSFNYTYPLPYAVTAMIHASGFSVQESVNLAVFASALLSVVAVFFLARIHLLSAFKSSLLSLASIANPYYLLLVYWRGALGELYFFAFVPVVLLGIELTVRAKQPDKQQLLGWGLIMSGLVGSVLSHVPSMVVLAPVLIGWVVLRVQCLKNTNRLMLNISSAAVSAGLLTAWYWLPALLERPFIVYDQGSSLTLFAEHLVNLPTLFAVWRTSSSSDFFTQVLQVGLLAVTVIGFSLFYARKGGKKYIFWLLVMVSTLLIMDIRFEWLWAAIPPLQFIQFPWRLLWLVNIGALLLSIYLLQLDIKRQNVLLALIIMSVVWAGVGYAWPKGYQSRSDYEWYESVATGSSFDEHRPIWAEQLPDFSSELLFLPTSTVSATTKISDWQTETNSSIKSISSTGTKTTYTIEISEPLTVVHHKLYFPGWEVAADNQPIEIRISHEAFPGLIVYELQPGSKSVSVSFTGTTPVRQVGAWLGVVGALFTAGTVLILKRTSH